WRARDGQLRVAFQQITGPVVDWKKRRNGTVILCSNDEAESWKKLPEVAARTNAPSDGDKVYAAPGSAAFCGHGLTVLPDGTLVTGLWATGQEKSGYIQRSTDDGTTWSAPIFVVDPNEYKTYPNQIRRLRDGRLFLVAGTVRQVEANTSRWLMKQFFESRDKGKTWSHVWTMPAEVGL